MSLINPSRHLASIPTDTTKSNIVNLKGEVLSAVSFPAEMTGTAISFLNMNGTTEEPVHKEDGTLYSITLVEGGFIGINTTTLIALQQFKILSNATELAARSIIVYSRSLR